MEPHGGRPVGAGYLRHKAEVFVSEGPEEYRANDALGMPPTDWDEATLAMLLHASKQLVAGEGLAAGRPLRGVTGVGLLKLLQLFHFVPVAQVLATPIASGLRLRHQIYQGYDLTLYRLVAADEQMSRPLFHPLAGLVAPTQVGEFTRTSEQTYDQAGNDRSVGYWWPSSDGFVELTLYVYPSAGRSDVEEVQKVVGHLIAVGRDPEVVEPKPIELNGYEGLHAELTQRLNGDEPSRTAVTVFEVGGWMVKIRATSYLSRPGPDYAPLVLQLLTGLGWPVNASSITRQLAFFVLQSQSQIGELMALASSTPDARASRLLLESADALMAHDPFKAIACWRAHDGWAPPESHSQLLVLSLYTPEGLIVRRGIGTLTDPFHLEGLEPGEELVFGVARCIDAIVTMLERSTWRASSVQFGIFERNLLCVVDATVEEAALGPVAFQVLAFAEAVPRPILLATLDFSPERPAVAETEPFSGLNENLQVLIRNWFEGFRLLPR